MTRADLTPRVADGADGVAGTPAGTTARPGDQVDHPTEFSALTEQSYDTPLTSDETVTVVDTPAAVRVGRPDAAHCAS